jgi:hypothetical protein
VKRLVTIALCAIGFILLTGASDYLRGQHPVFVNGKPFGNATTVGGVWTISLDDFERNVEGHFTVLGNRLQIARDPASGLPTGKRMHKPFVITKELDKSTPLLFQDGKARIALSDVATLFGETFAPPSNLTAGAPLHLNFTRIEHTYIKSN